MIKEINSFSLGSQSGLYEKWTSRTKLLYEKEFTKKRISGYVIEAQFKVGDYYLIITSYDCPYEETNSFILLDKGFKIIGKEWIGEMYGSFLLEEYRIKSDSEIILRYYRDFYLKLTLNTTKHVKLSKEITYTEVQGFD